MSIFKKLLFLLSPRERKLAILLLIMTIIISLFELLGIASILPFIAVLTNPNLIETNIILSKMFLISSALGIETKKEFLFVLGFLVFILLIISIIFNALTNYLHIRFVSMCEHSIGKRLIYRYLHQPFSWFLSQNSADLGKNILSEVSQVITNGLEPIMNLIAKSILVILLIVLLIVVDPKLALIVGLSLGCAYSIIFYFVRNFLSRIGKDRIKNNQLRFTAVSEAFGGAKEVKVGGLEEIYINKFSNSAQIYAKTSALSIIVGQLPRFFLEAVAFGGVLLMILYKMSETGSFNNALPVISLYVFAGYRLIPSVQQVYTSLTQLTFLSSSINQLYDDQKNFNYLKKNQNQEVLVFNKSITLKSIYYNYPNADRSALRDINLNIAAKSTVGIVGPTGSGKTTTVDIILGLLEPQKGTLQVDGKVITEQNSRSWQKLIGYVPQHIYLSDDTIMANIAFGVEPENINLETIKKVSKIANLHNFVVDELPKRYETIIGERGVRLSGGQRQRIGIARALYHNPKVLILDEATSALDNYTEKVVMGAVNNLDKTLTIILIAHRLNTVKNCDTIFLLDKGQIKGKGTFEELIKNNNQFKENSDLNK